MQVQRNGERMGFGSAGREIGDLYEYTCALRGHDPGDRIEIMVLREGERMTLSSVPGRR
ncbi:MAG: hypothetical protein OXI12_16000 [Gammaproteobacteria bacterium]|nr:hypothetical protein [Gammaproteobacteria bacterium]